MRQDKEILDPYGEPNDIAAKELAKAHSVKPGAGGRMLRTVVVLGVALGAGFAFIRLQKTEADTRLAAATREASSEPPTVNVVKVQRAETTQSLTLPGETAAWDETTIYSRVNGYVSKWFVDIGDHVAAGQSLASIDTPELDAELSAAKAKLNAAVADVGVRQAQADFAQTTEQRWRDSPKGVVSDQEREAKSAGNAEALANLAASRAQVALAQAEVDRLSVLTQFKDVKAPFEGIIIQRRIDVGDLVTAGSTANTSSLYRLSRDKPMRIFVHAPQSVAPQLINGGAKVEITSADDSTLRIFSNVARTARAVDPASRTMRVEADIPNPPRGLATGMYVRAKFTLPGAAAFQVPAAALLFRNAGPQVAVVGEDGSLAFKDVAIASDDGNSVEISSGLADGDRVALNLSSQIAAGVKVRAVEALDTVAATMTK